MKWFCALVLSSIALSGAANPQLKQVQSIYILPMGSGMDQFLASRLTKLGLFQVVADPQKADAIFTDRLGEPFENKLDELYPPPPPPPAAKEDSAAKDDKTAKSGKKDKDATPEVAQSVARVSSFGRGKGNFFVVDRRSRGVLWSIYERPRNGTADELNRIAERVVQRLKNDLKEK